MSLFHSTDHPDSPETGRHHRAPVLNRAQADAANKYAVNDRWPAAQIAEELMQKLYPIAVARLNAKMYGTVQTSADVSARMFEPSAPTGPAMPAAGSLGLEAAGMANPAAAVQETLQPAPPQYAPHIDVPANQAAAVWDAPAQAAPNMPNLQMQMNTQGMQNMPSTMPQPEYPAMPMQPSANVPAAPGQAVSQPNLPPDQAEQAEQARRMIAELHAKSNGTAVLPNQINAQRTDYGLAA